MPHSAYYKMIRAEEHLAVLKAEVATFKQGQPYKTVAEVNDDPPGYVARLHQVHTLPIRCMVTAGDCVHNLRCVLDHLAWVLVKADGGTPCSSRKEGRVTQFPILTEPRVEKKTGDVLPARIYPGVSDTAAALVEALQPYNEELDPSQHPLAVIQKLDNIDKHQRVTFAIAFAAAGSAFLRSKDGNAMVGGQLNPGPFFDGSVIGWFPFADPPEPSEVDVHAHFTVLVPILDASTADMPEAVDLLAELCQFVRESVLDRFARTCF